MVPGTVVATVLASDNDTGKNAQIVYTLRKNAVDAKSGEKVFSIDAALGIIKTAKCCLDREKTRRYSLMVVASDTGGLQGKKWHQILNFKGQNLNQ